jgi:hypothetical protein
MQLHAAPMPDRESLQAAMYGPLVVAARFDDEPKEKWYRHCQVQTKQEPAPPLQFKGKLDDPASWLQPGEGKLTFREVRRARRLRLFPCRASCMNGILFTTRFKLDGIPKRHTNEDSDQAADTAHVRYGNAWAHAKPGGIGAGKASHPSTWETGAPF